MIFTNLFAAFVAIDNGRYRITLRPRLGKENIYHTVLCSVRRSEYGCQRYLSILNVSANVLSSAFCRLTVSNSTIVSWRNAELRFVVKGFFDVDLGRRGCPHFLLCPHHLSIGDDAFAVPSALTNSFPRRKSLFPRESSPGRNAVF